ncbi:MAG: EamA family transporter [Pseudomonadota bacterium]
MILAGWAWALFTVVAAAAQTLRNATQKELTATVGTLGATEVRFFFGLPFALMFLAAFVVLSGRAPPLPDGAVWLWLSLGAVAQILATALMLAAMRVRSFVVTIALTKTEPVQVLVFGLVVLGETVPPVVALGVVGATLGVLLVSWPGSSGAPSARAAALGIAAGGFFALAAVGYRGGILALSPTPDLMAATTALALSLALQTAILLVVQAVRDPAVLAAILRAWRPSLLAGFMGAFASQMWFFAFALQTAAQVRTLALVEILFAQMLARRLFAQTMTVRERWGLVLLVLGVLLALRRG